MRTAHQQPIDYLVIGHITQDLVDGGSLLGGTASYSSLTASAFGLRTALVTACPKWLKLNELKPIIIDRKYCQYATTFENIESEGVRRQFVHHCAAPLGSDDIPEEFLSSRIVHLGPVAGEIDPSVIKLFPNSFIGLTPQGWMRIWSADGVVHFREWQYSRELLERADAVVFSIEDVHGNEDLIAEYARQAKVLAVTEGANGACIYWNSDVRRISAPKKEVIDPTGAGDIFAVVFFIRLQATGDPWQAGQQAVELASQSVTRTGLASIPTEKEIQISMVEVMRGS
jgi:sugar/nucleoside kinase (ribokinase family)